MPARRIKARWSAFTDFDKNGCRWKAQKGGKHSRPYVWDFRTIANCEHVTGPPEMFDPKKMYF